MAQLLTRRAFVGACATLAAGQSALAAPGQAAAGAIDVHHHVLPPTYMKGHGGEVLSRSPGYSQAAQWSPERSLAEMDAAGTRTAVLSMNAPIWFGDPAEARALAHDANLYAAELIRRFPGRFGAFAVLPLPDLDGSLTELAHALDVLRMDGVGLVSNYGDRYLGDPQFEPLLADLNRRGAVVYVHPVVAGCCQALVRDLAPSSLELPFDTSRTVASLLYSGALSRFPGIRWIFSHGGGTIPFLADRLSQWAKARPDLAARLPNGPLADLQRLHFDTASVTNRPAIAALGAFVPWDQILFGTDYPYAGMKPQVEQLSTLLPDDRARGLVSRGNAARLIPRLAGT